MVGDREPLGVALHCFPGSGLGASWRLHSQWPQPSLGSDIRGEGAPKSASA